MSKAHTSQSAALLDSAIGGELSHDVAMMHHKEGGGGAVGKGENIPARAEAPVSIDRRQQGGTFKAWESVGGINMNGDVFSGIGLDAGLDALHGPLSSTGGAHRQLYRLKDGSMTVCSEGMQ